MSAIESQDRPQEGEAADPNANEFLRLKREILAAERERSPWRKEAKRCYDYVAGHQWSDEDKTILAGENRPAIVFNRTEPLVKAVCGLEVNNRQTVAYLPRKIDSAGFDESVTSVAKWVRDECFADDEESEAFRDLTIAGEGWTETRMDFDESPLGKIVKERIDPLEMGVNKGASRANYKDAKMIYRIREMAPEDVRELLNLPDDMLDAVLDAKWAKDSMTPADGGRGNKKDYPEKTRPGVSTRGDGDTKTVTVVQCQYWRREPVNVVATENDDQPQYMNDQEFAKFQERAQQMSAAGQPMQFQSARSTKKVFYQCFIGMQILDVQPMKMGRFQFSAMTGERDRRDRCFYGMVRAMLDPQNWSNKWLSQVLHIMNSNAKGGLIAETDAFVNVKKAEREWSDPTKITWVKPGSIAKNKVKEKQMAQFPSGLDQLMMFAISSIRDVTGINLELLGQADREQAASLEQQRRQSAMTILATLFNNLRKYRRWDGELLLQFIWLLPDGTLARVLEQGQYKYIPFYKQGKKIEDYDIIIDEAPSSPDQKQFVWAITAQILQMNILPPPAIIALLKYSPYPESVVQEIQKALGIGGELPPDQLKQKLDQAEQALQVLEQKLQEEMQKNKDKQDDHAIEMLKIEIDEYKAKTDRLKAEWETRIDAATAVVDAASTPGPNEAGGEGGESAPTPAQPQSGALEQKVDQLASMVGQLVQMLSGQGQGAGAEPAEPPTDGSQPVTDGQGEM
jgi:hypothetical protein